MYKISIQRLVLDETNQHIGVAEAFSKSIYQGERRTWLGKTHTLIGCPEMPVWTKAVNKFSNATVQGSGTVTVNTGSSVTATICVISSLDNGATYREVVNNVSTATFTGVPTQFSVSITKPNYIPYLWPNTINIQNETFTGTAYIAADDINSGSAVTPTLPIGSTIVKNGANVFLHGAATIILDKGFEVEKGASFEAK